MKRSLLGYKVTVVSTMNTPRARTLILSAFDSENFRRISTRGFLYRLTRFKKKIKQCIGHCRTLLAKEKFDILFIVDHMGKEDFSSFALLLLRERERERDDLPKIGHNYGACTIYTCIYVYTRCRRVYTSITLYITCC